MIFADGCRICPQARQKVAGKYLLTILGAEDKVNMVLCVAVGHVFSVWAGNLTPTRESVATYGALVALHNFPRASTPGLGSFAPPGLVLASCTKEMHPQVCSFLYCEISIVTEAFASFYKPPLRALQGKRIHRCANTGQSLFFVTDVCERMQRKEGRRSLK
jgi:hypothetical protein